MKKTKFIKPEIEIYDIALTDIIVTSDPLEPELPITPPDDWGNGGWNL